MTKMFSNFFLQETTGLFQLESAGMKSYKTNETKQFDDIIALVALYRPGPMSNIPIYNDCKNGVKEPDYIHPSLKNILKPTYGDNNLSRTSNANSTNISRFTAGEADILRRAMGKKEGKLDKQKERGY